MIIPCITLYNPWATFIALGWKTIETRTHKGLKSLVGRTIGIHASMRFDPDGFTLAREWMSLKQMDIYEQTKFPENKIVALAYVEKWSILTEEDSENALILCRPDQRYGIFLKDIVMLSPPVQPVRENHITKSGYPPEKVSHQGIWYYNL